MVFGIICAGGSGTRMGRTKRPKQFLHLGNKPIIIHTLEKFLNNSQIDKVLLLIPNNWMNYANELVKLNIKEELQSRIIILEGGMDRNDTIIKGIDYLEKNYKLTDNDIIVTHDAVRPFINNRIIDENIKIAKAGRPCCTAVSVTDTIIVSNNGYKIGDVPDRKTMYMAQTPQTFSAKKFKKLYEALDKDIRDTLTDATKVFILSGEDVMMIMGDIENIKITYNKDLRIAEEILKNNSGIL